MGAIVQNGNIGAIIKNGVVYGGGIVEGKGRIKDVIIPNTYKNSVTQEYTSLITKYYDDNGIYDEDYKVTLLSYTATNKSKIFFPSWSQCVTNTSGGEGYISIEINGNIRHKKYLVYNTATDIDFPEYFELDINDVFTLNFGFDGAHTNIKYFLQTYPFIVEENEGGDIQINGVVKLTQDEYDNLLNKYSNKLYMIYDKNSGLVLKTYKGTEIVSNYKTTQEVNDYDLYLEDVCFNYDLINNSQIIYLDSKLDIYNTNRDWQMDFACDFDSTKNSECSVIGSNTHYEIFFENTKPNKIGVWGKLSETGTTDWYNYTNGQNFSIKKEGTTIKIIINGVEVNSYTKTFDTSTYNMLIGIYNPNSYSGYYLFYGTIKYFGFKWIDPPTPSSGADGLTYEVSVDNNYTLHLIEYDNGTQSQTVSLTDSDLSSPVTFGDIVISYANDTFIIKPDYTNGKSIKYDNVLYSGDNAIEFYEGEAGLPDYAEQGTFTLIGWIE